jgi:FO synthase
VKLAAAGTKAVPQGGANDLGGTPMEETISRMASSENGSLKTNAELEAMAAAIGWAARSDEGRRRLTLTPTSTN